MPSRTRSRDAVDEKRRRWLSGAVLSPALRPSLLTLLLLSSACAAGPPPECPKGPATPPATASASAPAAAAAPFRVLPEGASPVTFDRMAAFPEPGLNVPRSITFSPAKKSIAYLASENGDQKMALWAFDLDKKGPSLVLRAMDLVADDKPLSREEELRRERQRTRSTGITAYQWAGSSGAMLVPLGGDLFHRGDTGKVTQLTRTAEPELDPKVCKAGDKVMFVRGRELYSVEIAGGKEVALTRGAPEGVTHGQSDFNGQEELGEPSGYWLSPSCDRVAYLEVDERAVAAHPVLGYRGGKPDLMQQRYPAPGARNPSVKLGILDLASKKTTWLALPGDKATERYLGRVHWSPDGAALFFQALDRDQKKVALLRADAKSGAVAELAVETSPAWVDFADVQVLEKSPALLWKVARGGHHHLETRDRATGKLIAQLTQGDWDVTTVQAVDEEQNTVYFTATKASPVERQLYRVSLVKPGEPVRVTQERGVHTTIVSPRAGAVVDIHSAHDRAPRVDVRDLAGAALGALPLPPDRDIESLKLRPRQIVTVKSAAGDTLYGALLPPRDILPGAKHPAVVMVYGGPRAQHVLDTWAPSLLWQHLADRGFAVFQLDNRGSGGQGPAFEHAVLNRLGEVELADQLTGVAHLKTLPYVDGSRLGIYGHSYGGYMAAYAMFKAPGVFKAAVSASPVTEWRLYDSGYTERYMGTPASNPAGYGATDLTRLVAGLTGKLLLVHALMDENVHFQHTADLIDALVTEGKPFDLLVYPGERHGYRSPAARKYAYRKVALYFAEHL
jgi:dipeptidyl-peptidase-4